MSFRTDSHNNPTAFTVDLALEAGLKINVDFTIGDSFQAGTTDKPLTLHTARLIGDALALTIRVIDVVGFRTRTNVQRWSYISLPKFIWDSCGPAVRKQIIGWMYRQEGGSEMADLFA
jgi:hypothetical protein